MVVGNLARLPIESGGGAGERSVTFGRGNGRVGPRRAGRSVFGRSADLVGVRLLDCGDMTNAFNFRSPDASNQSRSMTFAKTKCDGVKKVDDESVSADRDSITAEPNSAIKAPALGGEGALDQLQSAPVGSGGRLSTRSQRGRWSRSSPATPLERCVRLSDSIDGARRRSRSSVGRAANRPIAALSSSCSS